MLKRLLSLVLAALIAVPAPVLPAQAAPPSIERPVAHAAGDAAPALPRLAQRLGDTIPPLYMLGGDDKIAPVASFNAATDPFPSAILSHSRTSLATLSDSTGKLTYAPNNLLPQSNTFSNAAWTQLNATPTSGQPDPFGGNNAWLITESNAVNDLHIVYQNATSILPAATVNAAYAIYVKDNGAGYAFFGTSGGTGTQLVVNLSTGAVNTIGSTGLVGTPTATNVGNGWWRLGFVSSDKNFFEIGTARSGAFKFVGTGQSIFVYVAALSAVTYETSPRTADQVITTSAAYYGPRTPDYTYSSTPGLLNETSSRTNLTTRSGELTNAVWGISGVTRGSDATLDLTGATAVKLSATATTDPHNIYNGPSVSITSGSTYTQSWFVKAGTHSKVLVNAGDGTNYSSAVFDISGTADGTATQVSQNADTAGAGKSKYLGSGWFRLSLTFTAGATSNRYTVVALAAALTGNVFIGFGDIVWTAAGTETIYIGQPQFEPGSYPTSYIPTAASSVTRAADALTAASLTTNPAIIQYRSISTGTRARKVINPWSGISSETDMWIECIWIYPPGTPAAWLNAHLTVDGPFSANDNANPFAPKFAANDNLPVHWRIAL